MTVPHRGAPPTLVVAISTHGTRYVSGYLTQRYIFDSFKPKKELIMASQ
jgi:siroheme synthase (precorrin-2 oxidase/ferrochelatase)